MDNVLSPEVSIPSINALTPLHQPEEDQQIIANNNSYPHYAQQMPPSPQIGMGSISGNMNQLSSAGLPSLMHTPGKMMHSYQPSYATPHSMMHPQTPV